MIASSFGGLVWLLLLLGPFLFIQRSLHREIQTTFYIITRHPTVTLIIFSLLFFPGVVLHETSHWLMARLLGVRTGNFSLLPRPLKNGRLQLGYVETEPTDVIRDSLIGVAPLITGGFAVAYLAGIHLGLFPIVTLIFRQEWDQVWGGLKILPMWPDFWLWFYLAFAISSTMMPSASDRQAWLPVLLVVGGLVVISLLAGAGPWMLQNIAPWFNQAMQNLAVVLSISLLIQSSLLIPTWGLRVILGRLTGIRYQ